MKNRLRNAVALMLFGALLHFPSVASAAFPANEKYAMSFLSAVAPPAHRLSDADWKKLPPHPRLFAHADRFETLKKQDDPVTRQIIALLRDDADKKLTAPELIYPPTGFLFDPVRKAQGRILTLAMVYRLTGEKRYFDGAKKELLRLADLPEWRPSHFLDTGEACFAAGVGLDWLYDDLSPDERDRITNTIVKNALRPSLEVKEGAGGWVDGDFNWNPVCNGGLVVGALAIAEREPEIARKIVDRAMKNVPHAEAAYAPDGTYPEGPSYWSYGTTFHVFLTEALRSVFGTSCGIASTPGFLKTADFVLQMVGPTGQDYNFSDYHAENLNDPVMLWFARERRSRCLADAELHDVAGMYDALPSHSAPPKAKPKNASRHLAFALLWWDNTLPVDENETLPLHWTASGSLPLAVLRSSWNDPDATYVALKGDKASGSHAHMDVGSFVLEANGVRWALDLGTESYNLMRAAKLDLWDYGQNSSRWTTFRVGPEGHNILRVNHGRQDVTGKAEIHELPAENGSIGNTVNLSPLYPQAAHVERRVRLFPDRSVLLEDEWTDGAQPLEVAAQWLTQATVTRAADGHGVLLQQAGKSLRLVIEPAETVIDIERFSAPKPAGFAEPRFNAYRFSAFHCRPRNREITGTSDTKPALKSLPAARLTCCATIDKFHKSVMFSC